MASEILTREKDSINGKGNLKARPIQNGEDPTKSLWRVDSIGEQMI
jgi:hypothetical protein